MGGSKTALAAKFNLPKDSVLRHAKKHIAPGWPR